MKGLTLTYVFLLIVLRLTAQTVFDVEVDELYLDDGSLLFINNGEANVYECDYFIPKVKDFHYSVALNSCDESNDWMEGMNLTKIQGMKSFKKPAHLLRWVKTRKFEKESNSTDLKFNSFIQYFNEHLISKIDFRNYNSNKPNWEVSKVEFWDYVFLRINGKYLIIALVDQAYENFDYTSIEGFLIPTDNGMVVILDGHKYEEQGSLIDTIRLDKYIPLNSFFRVKKDKSGYRLFDKLFQELIIEKVYDEIKLGRNFIFCKDANGLTVYDKSANKINIKHLQAAYDSLGSIQCIIKDEIKWLDYNWSIHDTFPEPQWGLCGTISSTERSIVKNRNQFLESYLTGYWGQKINRDSVVILDDKSVSNVTYLNSSNSNTFDEYSDLYAVFSFPYSYYILTKKNEKQLVSITNERYSKARKLTIERDYRIKNQISKDSITDLIENLTDEIKIEVIFKGDFESFGYNHPIKFETNGLYGYYPQNEVAKYKRLEKFNFFFAKFEDENGKTGWIDVYGKEYYKKK